jgi:FKBP-type peptidyl-prolyl cis-trans isomerase
LTALLFASCSAGNNVKLSSSSTNIDSVNYAIGLSVGLSVKNDLDRNEVEIKEEHFIAGLKDAFAHMDTVTTGGVKLDGEWANMVIRSYFMALEEKKTAKKKEEGKLFLDENGKNDSVKIHESGLQYKVLVEGTGISPTVSDTVSVKYKLVNIKGDIIESRLDSPISFPLSNMIKGWQEGIPLMKTGSKYVFYIPSELAYANGRLAGETLIFEVELVQVKKGKQE